jgi:hypothetical protein
MNSNNKSSSNNNNNNYSIKSLSNININNDLYNEDNEILKLIIALNKPYMNPINNNNSNKSINNNQNQNQSNNHNNNNFINYKKDKSRIIPDKNKCNNICFYFYILFNFLYRHQ